MSMSLDTPHTELYTEPLQDDVIATFEEHEDSMYPLDKAFR